MQRVLGSVVLAFMALACSPSASESTTADGDKGKGVEGNA
jgi:hypothetical protein